MNSSGEYFAPGRTVVRQVGCSGQDSCTAPGNHLPRPRSTKTLPPHRPPGDSNGDARTTAGAGERGGQPLLPLGLPQRGPACAGRLQADLVSRTRRRWTLCQQTDVSWLSAPGPWVVCCASVVQRVPSLCPYFGWPPKRTTECNGARADVVTHLFKSPARPHPRGFSSHAALTRLSPTASTTPGQDPDQVRTDSAQRQTKNLPERTLAPPAKAQRLGHVHGG